MAPPKLSPLRRQILQLAASQPHLSRAEIASQVGCHPSTVAKHLHGVRRGGPSAASGLLAQAVAEQPGGMLTSALQSESPDGLAHSAISALRRGGQPTPPAQASLDATLTWRDAWNRWHDAQGP